ncbi:hypothetical protein [Mesobacillus foraminis]|uniref:hypothetical protein n=1 Tax=Mesobacillus foraminis TaxID=279826 RepID=UPI0013CEAD33|nr:hypothetical protein [Mesobacillus foraminis]
MDNTWEYNLFTIEINRLQREYRRCENMKIKQDVSEDIDLLKEALNALNSGPDSKHFS